MAAARGRGTEVSARGHRSSLFTDTYGLKGYDVGGWLHPGLTMAVNKTGKPEAILTPVQWSAVAALAAQGAAATTAPEARPAHGGRFEPGQHVTLMVQDGPTLHAYVKDIADDSVDAGLTRVRRAPSTAAASRPGNAKGPRLRRSRAGAIVSVRAGVTSCCQGA